MFIPELFREIHKILQFEYSPFWFHPNPIKAILQFKDGYYFLPTFYVLCKHCRVNSDVLADQLFTFLDSEFHPLLDTLRKIDPKIIQYVSRDLTLNTLHFCANQVLQHDIPSNDTLKCIVENNKRSILRVASGYYMTRLIGRLQERYFPVQRFKNFKNACIWNDTTKSWQEIQSFSDDIGKQIQNLWHHIKRFLENEETRHPSFRIYKFNVMTVVDAIITTSIRNDTEQKVIDAHKWFLRLEGFYVLDLLTGHIGGVIPEFFISDLEINIPISRKQMIGLCCNQNSYHPLRRLYETLTNREFFSAYVQELRSGQTDNFYVPLCSLVKECCKIEITELSKSMLHFYINLCKWTSFDYDFVILLLNIFSSVYVGTHSNQQTIFIVRGSSWYNGVNELFQLMGRVFGGYFYYSIGRREWELYKLTSYRMIMSAGELCGIDTFDSFKKLCIQKSNTCKIFHAIHLHESEWKATEDFGNKVFEIPFHAKIMNRSSGGGTSLTTLEQMSNHSYMRETEIETNCYKGCFFMLYYHLKKCMNPNDVLQYYQEEGVSEREPKEMTCM